MGDFLKKAYDMHYAERRFQELLSEVEQKESQKIEEQLMKEDKNGYSQENETKERQASLFENCG